MTDLAPVDPRAIIAADADEIVSVTEDANVIYKKADKATEELRALQRQLDKTIPKVQEYKTASNDARRKLETLRDLL